MLAYTQKQKLEEAIKQLPAGNDGEDTLCIRTKNEQLQLQKDHRHVAVEASIIKPGSARVDTRSLLSSVEGMEGTLELQRFRKGSLVVKEIKKSEIVQTPGRETAYFGRKIVGSCRAQRFCLEIAALLSVITLIVLIPLMIDRLGTEFHMYTADANYYLGIGRAIANGFKLYTDLFDIKPPAIFYTAALSYTLTGGPGLTCYLSFVSMLMIGLVPVIALFRGWRTRKIPIGIRINLAIASVLLGGMLLLFVHVRSGHIQVENFGACFACLYLLLICDLDTSKLKPWSPILFLTALILMMAPMYKEPFVFVAIASALLFVRNGRDFLYKLILPTVYGGLFGVILLLISGNLKGYITLYLNYMMTQNMTNGALYNMLRIDRMVDNFYRFSPAMAILFGALFAGAMGQGLFSAVRRIRNQEISWMILADLIKAPLVVLTASSMVGTTGAYFGHHYVFAIPAYAALILFNIQGILQLLQSEEKKHAWGKIGAIAGVLACSMLLLCCYPGFDNYATGLFEESAAMQSEADYVDDVLDELGEERYQYFGFNGQCLNMYTRHIPMGPVFVQDWIKIGSQSILGQWLWDELDRVNVFVVQDLNLGDLTEKVQQLIDTEFTEQLPAGISAPSETSCCRIYFRKSAFTFE